MSSPRPHSLRGAPIVAPGVALCVALMMGLCFSLPARAAEPALRPSGQCSAISCVVACSAPVPPPSATRARRFAMQCVRSGVTRGLASLGGARLVGPGAALPCCASPKLPRPPRLLELAR